MDIPVSFKYVVEEYLGEHIGEEQRFTTRARYDRQLERVCAAVGEDADAIRKCRDLTRTQAAVLLAVLGVRGMDYVTMMAQACSEADSREPLPDDKMVALERSVHKVIGAPPVDPVPPAQPPQTFKEMVEWEIGHKTGHGRKFATPQAYNYALAEVCRQVGEDAAAVRAYENLTPRQTALVIRVLGIEGIDYVDMMAAMRRERPLPPATTSFDVLSAADEQAIDTAVESLQSEERHATDQLLRQLAAGIDTREEVFRNLKVEMRVIADRSVSRAVMGGYPSIGGRAEDFMHDVFMTCAQRVADGKLAPAGNDFMRYFNTVMRHELHDETAKLAGRNFNNARRLQLAQPESMESREFDMSRTFDRPLKDSAITEDGVHNEDMQDTLMALEANVMNILDAVSARGTFDARMVAHAMHERIFTGKTWDAVAAEINQYPGFEQVDLTAQQLVSKVVKQRRAIDEAIAEYAPPGMRSHRLYQTLFSEIEGPVPQVGLQEVLAHMGSRRTMV